MKRLYSFLVLLIVVPVCQAAQVGFNKVGYINANLPTNSLSYNSVAIQTDGKIVVVGLTDDGDGLIARYNKDGTLDRTFNGTGFVNANDPTDSEFYYSVALQADGKVVVVGQTDFPNNGLIARYNTDGTLDTQTFNTAGVNGGAGFINQEGDTNSSTYNSVAIQADGKIVVVGQTDADEGGDRNGLIARYNTDGTLDTQTFNTAGTPGYINVEGNTNSEFYYSVAIQHDGKIVVVGQTDEFRGLIARYNTDGTLDTQTFNTAGTPGFINDNQQTDSESYYLVAIQADGKIVVVGRTDDGNGLIARYNTDGTLDTQTFNFPNGFINANLPTNSLSYNSVAIRTDGKIVVVGMTDDPFNGLIALYNTDGTLDRTFNEPNGFVNQEGGTNSSQYVSVALQPDGKIVVVGQTDDDNGLIARYLSNGVFDAESNWNLKNYRESAQINNTSISLLSR